MKKLLLLFVSVLAINVMASTEKEKAIRFEQLPDKAQTFIRSYFNAEEIVYIKMETDMPFSKNYEVLFSNGNKLEFNKSGAWKEIQCKDGGVPTEAVPVLIRRFVEGKYPNAQILEMDFEDKKYEVKLSNRLEIYFDTNFNFIGMDD